MALVRTVLTLSETQGWFLYQALSAACALRGDLSLDTAMVESGLISAVEPSTPAGTRELVQGFYLTLVHHSCGHHSGQGILNLQVPEQSQRVLRVGNLCVACRAQLLGQNDADRGLAPFQGSPFGAMWASSIRTGYLESADERLATLLVEDEESQSERTLTELVVAQVRTISDPVWWIVYEREFPKVPDDVLIAAIRTVTDRRQFLDLIMHPADEIRALTVMQTPYLPHQVISGFAAKE